MEQIEILLHMGEGGGDGSNLTVGRIALISDLAARGLFPSFGRASFPLFSPFARFRVLPISVRLLSTATATLVGSVDFHSVRVSKPRHAVRPVSFRDRRRVRRRENIDAHTGALGARSATTRLS